MRSLGAVLVVASCTSGGNPTRHASVAWHPPVELAAGGGERGAWQQNDSRFDHVDDGAVALTATGTLVAWVDHARKDIFVQRRGLDPRASTGAPVNVSRSPRVFSWLPRLAVAGDEVFVLWQEIVFSGGSHGGEAFIARSSDGGASFDPPINLSRSRGGDGKGRITGDVWHNGSHDLELAPDGTLLATWTDYDGALWLARSIDRGATFAAPQRVATGPLPARAPSVAASRDGSVYLAWAHGEDPGADIQLAISRDGGTSFVPGRALTSTPTYSDTPVLALDEAGVLHLAYLESRGGFFDRQAVHYTRSLDRGVTFEPPRAVSRATGTESSSSPMIAVDGPLVVIAWDQLAQPRALPRGLALTYSLDGGQTFRLPTEVTHSRDPAGGWNGSHQGRLGAKLAVRDGRIATINSALAHGRHSRVWLVLGRLPPGSTRRPSAIATR